MRIAGFHKNSFIDYPGKMAAVIFTPGCNMNCYYCHNRSIIRRDKVRSIYRSDDIINFLKRRKVFLDGVVITGGEPTLQKGLGDFISEIRELGYAVKLDTNGTNPYVLRDLIDKGLLDYIAMDIKAPPDRYEEICGVKVAWEDIYTSIRTLFEGNVEYEFRTTLAPDLGEKDILKIARLIYGARLYALQQYRRPETNGYWDERLNRPSHTSKEIKKWVEEISPLVKNCIARGI